MKSMDVYENVMGSATLNIRLSVRRTLVLKNMSVSV
jgi:hypothetical protein